ncbi:hypothetical protein GGU10DRAFT_330293 [Lentinula aff. detonsa]|uniref:Uncharacterized protein n=1 Tax=Lentinula aff. detonsa TaxID=2804958 RepID=A0AA38KI63_9AGAR|nr:hypothetical protein GGU10DRAFT_330293 [Lentinula aff. detonsa]
MCGNRANTLSKVKYELCVVTLRKKGDELKNLDSGMEGWPANVNFSDIWHWSMTSRAKHLGPLGDIYRKKMLETTLNLRRRREPGVAGEELVSSSRPCHTQISPFYNHSRSMQIIKVFHCPRYQVSSGSAECNTIFYNVIPNFTASSDELPSQNHDLQAFNLKTYSSSKESVRLGLLSENLIPQPFSLHEDSPIRLLFVTSCSDVRSISISELLVYETPRRNDIDRRLMLWTTLFCGLPMATGLS